MFRLKSLDGVTVLNSTDTVFIVGKRFRISMTLTSMTSVSDLKQAVSSSSKAKKSFSLLLEAGVCYLKVLLVVVVAGETLCTVLSNVLRASLFCQSTALPPLYM